MTVKEIQSDEDFETFISDNSDSVIALNFWANFAAPSVQMNTVFKELSMRFSTVKFAQIDAETLEDISESLDVSSVPYFIILRGTEVLSRISGANPTELQSSLSKYAKASAIPAAQTTTMPPPVEHNSTGSTEEQDLNTRLGKLIRAAPVMLFMKGSPSAPQCGFSRTLVGLLREAGVRYGFFNILADQEVRQGLKEFSEWPTFPQLYVGGEFVGGLDVVREMIDNGEMTQILEEAGATSDK